MKRYIFIMGCIGLFMGILNGSSPVTENIPDPDFKPDALISLGDNTISVWDLIGKGEPQSSEGGEEIHITLQYLQENALTIPAVALYNISADTLLHAPYFQVDATSGIEFGVPLEKEVKFRHLDTIWLTTIPQGVNIKHMEDVADLEYVFPYTGFEYRVEITLKNIFVRGTREALKISEVVNKDNQKGIRRKVTKEFDIDLSKGNLLEVETRVVIAAKAVLFEPQTIYLFIKSLNMKLEKAVGYFPIPPLQLDSNNLKMNLDVLANLSNAFDIASPRYYLIVRNKGLGLPAEVDDLRLHATNVAGTRSVELRSYEEMAFEANTENVLRVDTFVFTPDNSNLVEFLSLPPHGNIDYNGTIRFNPNGRPAEDNVIYADGLSQVDSYIEVPMVMKGNALLYRDTLEGFDFSGKEFSAAQLTVTPTTDIPFTMSLYRLEFYDGAGNMLEKVDWNESLISGRTISRTITPEMLEKITGATYGIGIVGVSLSVDVLGIRQDAVLKLNYSLLGETKHN